jgi:hypothetical protein
MGAWQPVVTQLWLWLWSVLQSAELRLCSKRRKFLQNMFTQIVVVECNNSNNRWRKWQGNSSPLCILMHTPLGLRCGSCRSRSANNKHVHYSWHGFICSPSPVRTPVRGPLRRSPIESKEFHMSHIKAISYVKLTQSRIPERTVIVGLSATQYWTLVDYYRLAI